MRYNQHWLLKFHDIARAKTDIEGKSIYSCWIFLQEMFKVKSSNYSLREITNLAHYRPHQVTFGSNSLRSLGPQIWNGLPNDMKSAENLNILKDMLKKVGGPLLQM